MIKNERLHVVKIRNYLAPDMRTTVHPLPSCLLILDFRLRRKVDFYL